MRGGRPELDIGGQGEKELECLEGSLEATAILLNLRKEETVCEHQN
jgi:hypothetical protein